MSKKTVNQTNYQITQTGGKLDMSTGASTAVQEALGYGARSRMAFERAIRHYFTPEQLKALREKAGN